MEKVVFDRDRCKGCSLCVRACPRGIVFLSGEINRQGYHPAQVSDQERCTSCVACAIICPDLAIQVFR
ncbi:MAG: 4Fe-4S binding protein [Thermaerobacter sp.]|nr:4Fe-4S binding protein [Thermaerobacter sp.]MDA8147141.1 4Fe-4S binding protein [Thermaerobacter sp.]